MRILKRANQNAEKAKARNETDEARDVVRAANIIHHAKAVRAVEMAGYNPKSVLTAPKNPTPYDIEAQKIFASELTGKEFTPEHFKTGIEAYFREVDLRPTAFFANATAKTVELTGRRPYTLEGLCDHLGVTKGNFLKIAHDETYGELHTIAKMAEQRITARLLDLGLMKETDPSLTKFYLKNISDLQDKKAGTPARIGNITFVTVNNRDDARRLAREAGQTIDVEATPVDGQEGNDK